MTDREGVSIVAVVGRPNVGKSTLVNRLIRSREAIVEEQPGVTRDRRHFSMEWRGRNLEIVDTGGIELGATGLSALVTEQARIAVDIATVVLFVVDAQVGVTADDERVANLLRRSDKSVLVVVNKIDAPAGPQDVADFYALGLGDPVAVSALHGTGSGDLLDRVVDLFTEAPTLEPAPEWASIALIGRPNVGKSSLLNRLVGERRALVDAVPGTTRDPVDDRLLLEDGRAVRVIDTAGLRRQVKIDDPIEYFGWLRSRRILARADAAVLVTDVDSGITSFEQRIAQEIVEAGKACVVAHNKWDLLEGDEERRERFEADAQHKLRFLSWATVVRISAKTGRGVHRLLPAVVDAVDAHRTRVATSQLNRVIVDAQDATPHPRSGGRARRVRYAAQVGTSPPTFALFASGPLEDSYLRYLERTLRASANLAGTPVRLLVRTKTKSEVKS
ncbi:MAG: ribosome biogenesis GTPase Der [Actinomycetota bacterium]|nr:ribosome biogenesis GTPase Der [Actinomycetota bacterium]